MECVVRGDRDALVPIEREDVEHIGGNVGMGGGGDAHLWVRVLDERLEAIRARGDARGYRLPARAPRLGALPG
ncbi:hypothetical protein C5E06_09970 [Pseudoclavibacter sp. RFBI5]|nr:hypothetical protein C5E06_09970 [Pseudoclavibacter sp. RFBI5]